MDTTDLQFWKDWGEIIAAVIFGIVTIWLTVWVYRRQEKKKELRYSLESYSVLSPGVSKIKGLTVRYEEETVSSLWLTNVQVTNSGKLEIREEDHTEAMVLKLYQNDKPLKIIEARITDRSPSNVKISVFKVDDNYVSIEPGLLNAEDTFKLSITTIGRVSSYSFDCRIAGVKSLTSLNDKKPIDYRGHFMIFGSFMLLLGLFIGFNRGFILQDIPTSSWVLGSATSFLLILWLVRNNLMFSFLDYILGKPLGWLLKKR